MIFVPHDALPFFAVPRQGCGCSTLLPTTRGHLKTFASLLLLSPILYGEHTWACHTGACGQPVPAAAGTCCCCGNSPLLDTTISSIGNLLHYVLLCCMQAGWKTDGSPSMTSALLLRRLTMILRSVIHHFVLLLSNVGLHK